ncbi:MAG: TolC family protein [Bacteroidales bacterium]|nr:TolC family protein [Bacteroidales bacterium]MDD3160483.1 TolC family protein [Bacteroidales bacterium]
MRKLLKIKIRIALIIAFWGCINMTNKAQEVDSSFIVPEKSGELIDDNFSMLVLPPLDLLFENARKGPGVQLYELKMKEQGEILKREKNTWASFLTLGAGYHYGNVGMYSSYSDVSTPLITQYTGTTQSSWQVGVNLNVSLVTLLDLKPRIKRQKIAIEMANMEREQALDELRSSVVDMYTKAQLQISLLRLQAQAVVYANAMFKMVEQDFLNGQKDQADLSNAKSDQSKALVAYEESKSNLIGALLKLEIYTRTAIINNQNKKNK